MPSFNSKLACVLGVAPARLNGFEDDWLGGVDTVGDLDPVAVGKARACGGRPAVHDDARRPGVVLKHPSTQIQEASGTRVHSEVGQQPAHREPAEGLRGPSVHPDHRLRRKRSV
jgi:hypothetical protein